jgi:hypothetical protein
VEPLLRLIALLLLGYAALCAVLYLLQDRLIFFPGAVQHEPRGPHVQPASLQRADVVLRGWIVKAESTGPLVIYFGGNGEELSTLVDVFVRVDATTVLMNYRGYGDSEGEPSAAHLISDARAVVDAMRRRMGEDRRLILFGRSLGSGIAALTTRFAQVDATILMSPYRSLTRLAQRQVPFVPVRWLLRHRIDTTTALDTLPGRMLVLYATRDHIIPTDESRAFVRLLKHAPAVVEFTAGHNVPLTDPDIWPAIETFIDSFAAARRLGQQDQ